MTPRGIRNNNPLNIRRNPKNNWKGLKAEQTDRAFCQFEKMEYGIRAAYVLMMNYVKKGFDTPRKIIERWAPRNENNTDGYVKSVAMFLDVDKPLNNSIDYCRLAEAMAWAETGRRLSNKLLTEAWYITFTN